MEAFLQELKLWRGQETKKEVGRAPQGIGSARTSAVSSTGAETVLHPKEGCAAGCQMTKDTQYVRMTRAPPAPDRLLPPLLRITPSATNAPKCVPQLLLNKSLSYSRYVVLPSQALFHLRQERWSAPCTCHLCDHTTNLEDASLEFLLARTKVCRRTMPTTMKTTASTAEARPMPLEATASSATDISPGVVPPLLVTKDACEEGVMGL